VRRSDQTRCDGYAAEVSDFPLEPDDIRAAAAAHHELGPEYSDAVVEAFLDKVDRQLAARIGAQFSTAPRRNRAGLDTRTRHLPSRASTAAVAAVVPLVGLLILIHGSAAARADWYQWLTGTSLLIVVTYLLTAWALKQRPARERPAR